MRIICLIACRCKYLGATVAVLAEKLTEAEMDAWQALLHAHEQVTTRLDGELRAEHGLSLSEYDVLLRLARAPQRSLRMTATLKLMRRA